jgi:quercetin dioxygenase-like cupin family protein
MRPTIRHTLLLLASVIAAGAQTLIDNDQVRVLKVTDQPHVKTAPHEHKINRVMVYLNAGKQDFMVAGKKSVVEYKAGEVLWSPTSGTHTAEVVSATPLTIVEVEIKKPADSTKSPKTALDPVAVDSKHYHVEFENPQVRVVRVHFGAHETAPLHEHVLNRVVVYLTDQNTRMTTNGKTDVAQHKPGDASWGGPAKHTEENLMDKPFEAIVVELKN